MRVVCWNLINIATSIISEKMASSNRFSQNDQVCFGRYRHDMGNVVCA